MFDLVRGITWYLFTYFTSPLVKLTDCQVDRTMVWGPIANTPGLDRVSLLALLTAEKLPSYTL